jgi:2-polyprenyl-3-methyl-5-hydroxy-6-metoxy-1,4-benzoquinol methylase
MGNVTHSASENRIVRDVTRTCPVCDGRTAEPLFEQGFQPLEKGGPITSYDVVVCTTCGLSFADGIPAQAELDEYYRELSKYEYAYRAGKESEDDSHRLKILADVLQSIIPDQSSRILEVGCANGRLLSYLKQAGYRNVTGVDPSPGCARAARTLYDISVEIGTVFGLPKTEAGYDVVVTLGVLEHIRDLKRAVQNIREATSKDGRVFVGVPDASNLIAAQDAPFQEFSTEHINFFSPTSLQYLMEATGFHTVSCASVNLELHCGVLTPCVCGVFEHSTGSRTEFPYDETTREGLVRYIDECEAMDKSLRTRIRQAVDGRTVLVWGVGTHTRRLLANNALHPSDISAFVDGNPKFQGRELLGVPVLSPDKLIGHPEPILISSYAFQTEIAEEIRKRGLRNETIMLYDMNDSRVSHG